MAITLKERLNIGDATATPWGGIGSQYDKKKFEKDIAGGGYSGLPFIKPVVPKTLGQYFSITTEALSLDYPIRGGSYEELAARQDFARIDRFMESNPQGRAFVDKMTGLALSNPKIETGYNGGVAGLFGTENTRFLSVAQGGGPINLLTQLTAGGTGFHYPLLGQSEDLLDPINLYAYTVAKKPTNENRLVSLYNLNVNSEVTPISQTASRLGLTNSSNNLLGSFLGSIPSNVLLQSYVGGPGSRYGLGNTDIFKATNAAGAPISTNTAPLFLGSYTSNIKGTLVQGRPNIEIDYNNLLGASLIQNLDTGFQDNTSQTLGQEGGDGYIRAEQNTAGPTTTTFFSNTLAYDTLMSDVDGSYNDFRTRVMDPSQVASSNYKDYNMPRRIGTGDVGIRTAAQRKNVSISVASTIDTVNASEINGTIDGLVNGEEKEVFPRDLIKFRFQVLDNKSGLPTTTTFRAFLTDYSDNHSAEWNAKRYTGRGENFYTYQGHDRTVGFSFMVAAQSKQEMAPLYRKLNFLLSSSYPDYTPGTGFMRGNITTLTIGDLFVNAPGILTSLNLTVDNEYPWEIAMDEPELGSSKDMKEVPQMINVRAEFKPILSTLPTKGTKSKILFANDARQDNNWLTY